ncbi:MAG TPA: glycine cleavage system aminomethyltransferase GcvT [Candidatus Thermoplasmatota archaeon]|nr:glycine cleavage system aminomethyltransferase GcvT [Candidatus Thermoplasmatota archaeon]
MTLLRTPLYDLHVKLGAKIVPFAGYEMPVMYSSVLEEHEAVRKAAGLFDVSHMSNLWVTGPEAVATLNRAFVADASKVPVGGTKYTAALRPDGTIVDDLYIFHVGKGYHVVPNAGMNAEVAGILRAAGKANVEDVTRETCILALQGPKAAAILERFMGRSFADLKRFHLTQAPALGADAFIARTGYTGEDGFELFVPAREGARVFEALLAAGAEHGIRPCGLGARDTLRLEKGYCLAGHEFKGGRTPLEAGLGWLVAWDHDFTGKAAIEAQKAKGGHAKLVGVKLTERGIPREGNEVRAEGRAVGVVSSGTQSPALREGIALAYVEPAFAKPDTPLEVVIRDKPVGARVVKLPFV